MSAIDPGNKLNYIKVDPPADTDASWVLLYSKDHDSPPIRNFEFSEYASCLGKQLADIKEETLSR